MAKTKALISFAVTAKLICVFVFANAKGRFSHDAAHLYHAINRANFDVELFRAFEKISQCILCGGPAQLIAPRIWAEGSQMQTPSGTPSVVAFSKSLFHSSMCLYVHDFCIMLLVNCNKALHSFNMLIVS